ncbi:hypothetical protein [Actinomadura violacea]|uniref:Uncharacterized protein n=1 Tax=Actinomadura violacea TaxID=2819934 RepID=A0ABS3S7K0_9ACTN|nr:hypothetical protein [Actinomadura violacea]MBO2464982.1 hypothetical protein [Actinomadura violacea]
MSDGRARSTPIPNRSPNLSARPPVPAADLVLILPDGITDTDVLEAIADTFTKVRATLAGHAAQADRAAAQTRDQVRRAGLAGQAAASRRAVALLDETITGQLNLWTQYDRWRRVTGSDRPSAEPGAEPAGGPDGEQLELP